MKDIAIMKSVSTVLSAVALLVFPCGAARPCDAEYAVPVRPGAVNGSPFWNGEARQFMYAPAFAFEAAPGAAAYRFDVTDDLHDVFTFTSSVPTAALSPVWNRLRPGYATVVCTGLDAAGKRLGEVGRRTFWRSAPFREGAYPKATRSYADCATRIYDFLWDGPFVKHMREIGAHDGGIWLAHYLCKMNGAIARGMCTYAKMRPDRRAAALKTAIAAGEEMLKYAGAPGTPLAYFPPTYLPQSEMTCDLRYDKEAWRKMMLIYPVTAAEAYLDLHAATGDAKWLAAAENVAGTFLRIQGADGSWPLLVSVPEGKPIAKNRCMPITHILLFERLFGLTGKTAYREAGDRAFAWIEKGPLADWNWEGQFEDTGACARYRNLTHIGTVDVAAYLLKRFPDNMRRLAQARELIRFAEDQFVIWEPIYGGGRVPRDLKRHPSHMTFDTWVTPAVCEQWECFSPVDASAANMVRAWIALHKATGEARPLAKARAIADTMTRVQHANGDMPTWWRDHAKGVSDWVNCTFATANALSALAETVAADTRKPAWRCVWRDEFDGPAIDRSKWCFEEGFVRNRELQYYTARPENARIENGVLVIEGRHEKFANAAYDPAAPTNAWQRARREAEYTSAALESAGRFDFTYGRLECRAKLPACRGTWPAIWTLGRGLRDTKHFVNWPDCGEIDVMEHVGFDPGTVTCNVHGRSPKTGKLLSHGAMRLPNRAPYDGFHVYAMEWDEKGISFFYDGEKYGYADISVYDTPDGNAFRAPHFILLNLALGGGWGGVKGMDEKAFPQRFEIDWIRVYSRK